MKSLILALEKLVFLVAAVVLIGFAFMSKTYAATNAVTEYDAAPHVVVVQQ